MIYKTYFEPASEETQMEVWRQFDKTKEVVKKDIEIIRTWLKAQPHLPHTLTDHQIQSFLLIGRGSVEKIKAKIDMYYTMRSLFPDIFEDSHPTSKRILKSINYMYIVPVPKCTFDFSRIVIFKIKDVPDPSGMEPLSVFAHLINIVEVRLLEDFCSGHTVLFDLEHCKFHHVTKVTPSFVRSAYTVGEKALTTRVHGIHLINAPKFFDQVVMLVKSIVKPKMANKIHLHKDMKSVIDSIDRDILPRDYGGNEKSLDELEAEFAEKFKEYNDFFNEREKLKVNEDLRPERTVNDDILGYHGSFKKLDVD